MPVSRRTHDKRADVSDDLYEEEEAAPLDEEDDAFDEDEDIADEEEEEEEASGTRRRALSAVTAGRVGVRHIAELTGREAEGVVFVQPEQDGWRVGVEVVEDRRVPSSGDILALYEIDLDREGDLLSYRRTRRYKRGRGDDGEAH
ncbi:Gas vesicle synthesis protein GvpO [Streptosporangium canum]|uniref:Gas vesicle synthesis protein GvpO n=1 Tax=Streptosporangium canum TaxID=324952 RepID=A0A1I3ZKB8_9ACTN|nr:gas vesicle protein GvpO [Streptosporangium canum]SFK44523.1 Gas vesicle synthesis protein GvpO [Streptosporangium canum]